MAKQPSWADDEVQPIDAVADKLASGGPTAAERAQMEKVAAELSNTRIAPAAPAPVPAPPAPATVMRDTFSMPTADYALIEKIMNRVGRRTFGKSAAVRAALRLLASLDDAQFHAATADVNDLSAGRKKR